MTAINSCSMWRDVPSWLCFSTLHCAHVDRANSILPNAVDDGVGASEISFDRYLWPDPFKADFGEHNCRIRIGQSDLLIPLRCLNESRSYGLVP
jgi:hypothetical protein